MKKTIKDIAAELNVSPTTVSLIINDRPCRISEQVRQSVLDCVKKYNYTPNSSARALVMKKSQVIGLIVPDISNPFFAELAKGVEQAAQKKQYSVIFCNSNNIGQNDIKNFSLLIGRQVDGIILASSLHDKEAAFIEQMNQMILDNHVPVILADRRVPGFSFDSALIDHKKGGMISTDYLLSLGHQKIGCITGPFEMESAKLRYQGYADAMTRFGITPDPGLFYAGNYKVESGVEGAKQLIENGATAIFSCNDMMALGAIRQARIMGRKPGMDLAVMGFDNITLSELIDPPLTTINQPVCKLGKHCFHLLHDLILEPEKAGQSVMLRPTLIVRESTCHMVSHTSLQE